MHLIILHHGLWGNKNRFQVFENMFKSSSKSTDDCHIENIGFNKWMATYDGIDVLGDRLVDHILRLTNIAKISFIGYSLGGLVCRYAIGKLFKLGYFKIVKAYNFITFATPHLGSSKNKDILVNHMFNTISSFLIFRTGKQLYFHDSFVKDTPLLLVMSDPYCCFHKGLKEFKKLTLFSNIKNDPMVSYKSASISETNLYKTHGIESVNSLYPSIVNLDKSNKNEKDHISAKNSWTTFKISPLVMIFGLPVILFARVYKEYKGVDVCNKWFHNDNNVKSNNENKNGQSRIQYTILKNLEDGLDWERVDVCLDSILAHEIILPRKENTNSNDILKYCIEKTFLFY